MPARKRVLVTDAATAPGSPLGSPPVTMICEAQRSISVAQPIFDAKIFDVQKFPSLPRDQAPARVTL
jgi:hypothetical protein